MVGLGGDLNNVGARNDAKIRVSDDDEATVVDAVAVVRSLASVRDRIRASDKRTRGEEADGEMME